jgi:hypothetical protein
MGEEGRSRVSGQSLPAAERDICLQARRGLAIYFAFLVPLSAAFEALMILDDLSWFWALMWTPAAASVVARLVLREGFADVSFRIGGRRGWKAVGLALIFPIIVGLISYGIAWVTGLVHFSPQPIPLAAQFVGDNSSPVVVFLINLAVAATVVTILSVRTAAGEEIGWRSQTCAGERHHLGCLARAAHSGRRVPRGSAAGALGIALGGYCHSV